MIELRNIFKYYKGSYGTTYVLRDVSLTIEEGEFVTIMGPSGAGKSTLLHIMGMLDEPSEGEYYFTNISHFICGCNC
jgi:ABC-type lipoprotein export system ATPase subunit